MMIYPDPAEMDEDAFQALLHDEKQDLRTLVLISLVQGRGFSMRLHSGDVRFNGISQNVTDLEKQVDLFPCQDACKYEEDCKERAESERQEALVIRKEKRDWWGQFKLALAGAAVSVLLVLMGYFLGR